jgi:hypothetical protein
MKKRKAKMDALSNLSNEMSKMMGDDYAKGLGKMKVTVASDSEKGLKEGLDKAQEIMKKKLGEKEMDDSYMGERSHDTKSMDYADKMMDMGSKKEDSKEDPEYLKKKIEELQKKLAELE